MKKFILILSVLSLAVLAVSCESVRVTKKTPAELFQVDEDGVFELRRVFNAPDDDLEIVKLPCFSGEETYAGKRILLTNADIISIKAIERKHDPLRYDLELTLTELGVKRWNIISKTPEPELTGIFSDGLLVHAFKPRKIYERNSNKVVIDGPVMMEFALTFEFNSEKNHREAIEEANKKMSTDGE